MPVKKFLVIAMAVMCLMSLMCVTAFAAEADLPPGAQLVANGATISTNDLTSLDTPYVIAADGVETITITGLFGFSSVYGWNGTQWVNLNVADPTDVMIVCADYPQYTYYTMLRGSTMASKTVTVSWVKPSQTETIIKPVPSVTESLLAVVMVMISFVSSQALAMLPVYIGLIFVGILLAVSLIRNR